MRGSTLTAAAAIAAALLLAGCSSGGSPGDPTTAPPPTGSSSKPSATGEATTPATSVPPTAAASSAAPKPTAITGYGATVADWERTHTQVKGVNPGTAYNPSPGLNKDSGANWVYSGVLAQGGRQTYYSLEFATDTPRPTAEAQVRAELPLDAVVVWERDTDGCHQIQYSSATLAAALGNPGGVLATLINYSALAGSDDASSVVDSAVLQRSAGEAPEDAPEC